MKIKILCFLLCLYTFNSYSTSTHKDFSFYSKPANTIKLVGERKSADTTENTGAAKVADTTEKQEEVVHWVEKNVVGVNFNEVAFINWNSGGNNSISALFHGDFQRNYKKDHLNWRNQGTVRYGLNAQEGRELRKTDDEMRLSSSLGYRRNSESNWFYSAKFTFNSQFAHGYKYPEKRRPISKFMAPGYLFLGVGIEYSAPNEDLNAYLSPITQKSTFVLDERMANEGMFGVEGAVTDELGNIIQEGEKVRNEVGFNATANWSREIFENVKMKTQISLYSDWLHKFGNIDVDWQLEAKMKVNDFINASVGTHLRYDDDVKHKEDIDGDGDLETVGPKVQLKQMLGVGVVYEF